EDMRRRGLHRISTNHAQQQFTMAEALKSSGYKTIHLGKYHIGKNPLEDGFDVNVGGDQNGSPTGGYYSPWKKSAMKSWTDQIEQHPTHRVDVFADQAVEFMRENVSGPMFIHFSPYLVHSPLTAVPEFVDGYADKGIDPRYGSMVQKLDQAIGRLLDALDALKIADQTLVIFSSDNGGIAAVHPQAPFRAGKGSYYDGGIREPMVARWPGKIRSGSVCSQVVNTIDLFPTFVDVSQTSLPSQVALDGASLLPLLTESGEWTPRTQYWHFPVYLQKYRGVEDQSRDPLYRTRPGSAMRDGKWKLHEYFEDGSVELYDLETDPGERNNLSSTRPEVRTQLYQKLVNWRKSVNAPVPSEKNPKFNPEKERKGIQEALEKARR
ncbi:MAG: sulfatase-like hydrolase/transferase, partial [Planctomycetota bacterium]